jgi:hypothetical protein
MLVACSALSASQLMPRNLELTLRKFEVATGKEVWSAEIPAGLDPRTVEVFDERIVAYFYRRASRTMPWDKGPPNTEVLFFDSKSGEKAPPFDTRDYARTRDDPLRARSSSSWGPVLDPRNEIHLANGWISHGLGRMASDGNRKIHFFQETSTDRMNDDSHRDWIIR